MKDPISHRLPKTFWWANLTQFGGAMNDNLFKLFMIYALISWNGEAASAGVLASVGLAFSLPFLLITPVAGSFADHFSKRKLIVILKGAEIGVMSFGVFALSQESAWMLYATILMMSSQSALYGPCKYGIIPEQVGTERISRANGLLQMFTFLAILAGTIIAPELSLKLGSRYSMAAALCIVVAVMGFVFSLQIEPSPAHPKRRISMNGFMNLYRTTRVIRKDGFLTLAVLATSFFSMVGAYMQLNILDYGVQHLALNPEQSTRLFLLTAMGIGTGSVIAGWLSGRLIEFGIVPIGAALMCVCLFTLGTVSQGAVLLVSVSMLSIGLGAGLYIVPLESFIQYRSPSDKVGSVKAANGFLSWIGILGASGLLYFNSAVMGWTAQSGFLILSILLLALSVISFWILPDFFVKFIIMCLTRTVYRLRVFGLDNLPSDRAALLVCNHVSLLDAVLVVSSQQRRIRSLMSRNFYLKSSWITRKIVDLSGVILIQDTDGPKSLVKSLANARKALDDGFLVCIFAEGGLSLSGLMRPFRPGFERIVRGSEHPIIPVYIGGAWGSVSSWKFGVPKIRPWQDFRHPVSVHYGEELSPESTVQEVQQAVCEVSAQTFAYQKDTRVSLIREFIRVARRNWKRIAVIDATGRELSYGELLMKAVWVRDQLGGTLKATDKHVAVLLPNGIDSVLVNLALGLNHAIAINLDYTNPTGHLEAHYRLASVGTAITSRALIQGQEAMPLPDSVLYVEDLLEMAPSRSGLVDSLRARFERSGWLSDSEGFDPDEIATVQFTRGTTGAPKGVCLSHHNVLSNIEALREVIRPTLTDTLVGTLPFHSILGYSITFWFPLLSGLRAVYCSDPLDAGAVGTLSAQYKASILPTTPAPLLVYCQSIPKEAFSDLRYVFTGGEKLPDSTAEAFEAQFGVPPMEGYGATELSPVCAISLPDMRINTFRETGVRKDMHGRPLPGIALKVVNSETGDPLPAGEIGLIHVKGPNVMLGYLGQSGQGNPDERLDWYNTGDLGLMDSGGFLSVTGRSN